MSEPSARVTFLDRGLEPTQQPDPRYPNGIDIDISDGAPRTCLVALPYPAARCGLWAVECTACKRSALITCAGRRDDPRTVKMACKVIH